MGDAEEAIILLKKRVRGRELSRDDDPELASGKFYYHFL